MDRAVSIPVGSALPIDVGSIEVRSKLANGSTVRQLQSDVNSFSDGQRIFQFNAQVSHSAIDLRVAQQKLDGAKVARLAENFRCFSSAHRVGSVAAGF